MPDGSGGARRILSLPAIRCPLGEVDLHDGVTGALAAAGVSLHRLIASHLTESGDALPWSVDVAFSRTVGAPDDCIESYFRLPTGVHLRIASWPERRQTIVERLPGL